AAVDPKSRKILSLIAAPIASFGHLSKISKKKYGKRHSRHNLALEKLFNNLSPVLSERVLIRSDEHKLYSDLIKRYVPQAKHEQFKSIRGSNIGQGELKKTRNDPLHSINHTFAMMRDNLGTLVRKSWCVTQDLQMLQYRLEIYMNFHNKILV
ncbi:hypothetical protein N9N67_09340, partial [Bacteriovoracaceae bacterium]|nr:hypothetical protein [Bacteriovoracaceae bacterium]